MRIAQNTFKAAIRDGKKQYGIWCGLPGGYTAEICAGSGFDWLLIDGEHAPFDLNGIITHMQCINQYDVHPMVRIPSADPNLVKQLVDAGAQTILVPMIESADQARMIARSMLYPSRGTRGIGTALARAAQWNRVNNYFKDADDQMCCIGQVETVEGVENLDDILEVTELDGVFIGPADLAASMGHLGNAGHPDVVKTVVSCIRKIVAKGKFAGFLTLSPDLIDQYSEAGAQMIGVGIDSILLAKAAEGLANKYKKGLDKKGSNTSY